VGVIEATVRRCAEQAARIIVAVAVAAAVVGAGVTFAFIA
jgi:hypothetical protein